MTINGHPNATVHLSVKDWVGIVGVAFTILAAIMGVYVHHDRQLTEVITRQEMVLDRVNRIEDNLDKR